MWAMRQARAVSAKRNGFSSGAVELCMQAMAGSPALHLAAPVSGPKGAGVPVIRLRECVRNIGLRKSLKFVQSVRSLSE